MLFRKNEKEKPNVKAGEGYGISKPESYFTERIGQDRYFSNVYHKNTEAYKDLAFGYIDLVDVPIIYRTRDMYICAYENAAKLREGAREKIEQITELLHHDIKYAINKIKSSENIYYEIWRYRYASLLLLEEYHKNEEKKEEFCEAYRHHFDPLYIFDEKLEKDLDKKMYPSHYIYVSPGEDD